MEKVVIGGNSLIEKFKNYCKKSMFMKIVTLGFIFLVLLIPYFMLYGLRNDRSNMAAEAEREVSMKWGGVQLVTAPILNLPVFHTNNNQNLDHLAVLPDSLQVESEIVPEIRYRGIYQVMLYKAHITMRAKIIVPTSLEKGHVYANGYNAFLTFRVSDIRGLNSFQVNIEGQDVAKAQPGRVVTVPVNINYPEQAGKEISLTAVMDLNGFYQLVFSPVAKTFELSMTSPWRHPSFCGSYLPNNREVTESGFKAKWIVNELNRQIPQTWYGGMDQVIPDIGDYARYSKRHNDFADRQGQVLGVSLVEPANTYQQVERVTNYAFLVIAIVLVSFLIGETLMKIWVHPVQYFFVGLSIILFYVLLLALAEHISFLCSYIISTLIISAMSSLYAWMIFANGKKPPVILGGVMLLAYGLVYVLVNLEDYALLAGSIILLVLLGVLMLATGNLNKEDAIPENPLHR